MRILLLNTVKNFPSVYPWEGYRCLTVVHNNKVSSFRWVSCCFQASALWSKSCEREKTRKQMQLVTHFLRCRYLVVGSQFPNLKKTERLLKKSIWAQLYVVLLSSVAQLCPTLCNPMGCSTPGLHVHHQLPEFFQTHIH